MDEWIDKAHVRLCIFVHVDCLCIWTVMYVCDIYRLMC